MDKKIALSFKEDTDITTAMEETLQYNDERSRWKIEIKAFLEGITKPPVSQFHLGTQSVPNILNSSINTAYRAVQLSKLTIKPFRGDPLDWLTFWNGFSTSIHENPEMSNIDKMKYSCSYLIGDAAKAIAGLPLSNGNYNRAVKLLKQRFGRTQTIINSCMDALTKLPATTSDFHTLRNSMTLSKILLEYSRHKVSKQIHTATY